jgi:D-threo-aldose 1-dehydrogenase
MTLENRTFTTRGGAKLDFTRLGFGSGSIGDYPNKQTDKEATETIEAAWDAGERYFDTAPLYGLGLSEKRLGAALRMRPRDGFVLSSKVGRLIVPAAKNVEMARIFSLDGRTFVYDYSYDGVMRSYDESRARLGIDRIDILFVHDPDGRNHGSRAGAEARLQELMKTGGWRALDELRASGAVKAIGCGVNEWEPCARLLELADPDLFLIAGRYTLLEQEPLNALFPACEKRGVGVVIGGPLNAGALVGRPFYDYAPITKPILARVASLKEICDAHKVAIGDAALQFAAAHPVVVSVLSGPASAQEVRAYAQSFNAPIPGALWKALKEQRAINLDAPTP